jgi:putative membrane protein
MEQKSGRTVKRFLQGWVITTFAVLVAAFLLPGISYSNDWRVLLLASLLLGVLNAVVRPILMLIALPLLVLTLGLFMVIINALLLLLVGRIVNGFEVASFGSAVLGSIIISLVSLILNLATGSGKSQIHFRRGGGPPRQSRRGNDDDGSGPVIDV